jgi:hypothetical protein
MQQLVTGDGFTKVESPWAIEAERNMHYPQCTFTAPEGLCMLEALFELSESRFQGFCRLVENHLVK